MFKSLPQEARTELVINYPNHPMTLNVCFMEVTHDTKVGKEILQKLGYKDD